MKLFTRIFMFALVVMVGALILIGIPGPEAQAELTKGVAVTLSGVNLSTATGNVTGAQTGARVGKGREWPNQYTCYGFVTNSAGTAWANGATALLQGSYDNSHYQTFATLPIGNSVVNSTTDTTADLGRYWRVNVSAIQNSNDTYVNVQCLFD